MYSTLESITGRINDNEARGRPLQRSVRPQLNHRAQSLPARIPSVTRAEPDHQRDTSGDNNKCTFSCGIWMPKWWKRTSEPDLEKGGKALNDLRSASTSKDLDNTAMKDWVFEHHRKNLITELSPYKPTSILSVLRNWRQGDRTPSIDDLPQRRFRIDFAEAQRMRIRMLHCQLIQEIFKVQLYGTDSIPWQTTLQEYIKALQDLEFMQDRSKLARDPFLATGEFAIDHFWIKKYGRRLQYAKPEKVASLRAWQDDVHEHPDQKHPPLCGTRSENRAHKLKYGRWKRIMFATTGGVFLIAPMWMMVLLGGLYPTLIITTGSVTVLGLLVAFMLEHGKDVLGSTAAYAAVLVVFVGTSNV